MSLDGWLWGFAALVGATALVRLMRQHRDRLVERFRKEFEAEEARKAEEAAVAKKAAAKAARQGKKAA